MSTHSLQFDYRHPTWVSYAARLLWQPSYGVLAVPGDWFCVVVVPGDGRGLGVPFARDAFVGQYADPGRLVRMHLRLRGSRRSVGDLAAAACDHESPVV